MRFQIILNQIKYILYFYQSIPSTFFWTLCKFVVVFLWSRTGGIPARNTRGERLLLYMGVIDILQSYRLQKKLEHVMKAMVHDGVRQTRDASFVTILYGIYILCSEPVRNVPIVLVCTFVLVRANGPKISIIMLFQSFWYP